MSHLRVVFMGLLMVLTLVESTRAQPAVRPYPDPGYRQLGVYGGGDERYFDYQLKKIKLGESFPNKEAWWAGLKANRLNRDAPGRHDIYLVYCGERDASLETAQKRLDAWLQSDPECPTFPDLTPGQRRQQLAQILARGILRRLRRLQLDACEDSPESSGHRLDVPGESRLNVRGVNSRESTRNETSRPGAANTSPALTTTTLYRRKGKSWLLLILLSPSVRRNGPSGHWASKPRSRSCRE